MSTAAPVVLGWSGGKDSALSLYALRADPRHEVRELVTTVTDGYDRISIHGVRRSLLHAQARALGLPVREVRIPAVCTNDEYEGAMVGALAGSRATWPGLELAAFGDLFLADVRAYRERLLERAGLRGLFPLWGRDTAALAREVVRLGFRAVVVCVDNTLLDPAFAGREYDDAFLDALPATADPCGERGEFHTFVYDGPIFADPVRGARGEVVVRDGRFVYCDLTEPA